MSSSAMPRLYSLPLLLLFTAGTLGLLGCHPRGTKEGATQAAPQAGIDGQQAVRLLVVDDPALAEVIDRQWQARAEGKLELAQTDVATLLSGDRPVAADAIIYPTALLGELVQRKTIVPLPATATRGQPYVSQDVFELIKQQEMMWGGTTYALSFGSPQLVLMYRADLFERLGLEPPATWTQYQQVAEQLAARQDSAEPAQAEESWQVCAEPLGAGWAGRLLLARAAAYAQHPSQYSTLFNHETMDPLIDGPPFIRALDELVAAANLAGGETDLSPHDVRARILQGQCALAITWPTAGDAAANQTTSAATTSITSDIGFAALPGATEVYNFRDQEWDERDGGRPAAIPLLATAGRSGSVTARARNPQAAGHVLAWLTGKEWSEQIAPHSPHTTLYRNSHLGAAELWVPRTLPAERALEYAELVERTQNDTSGLFAVRIPGSASYLEALDEAVHAALQGTSSQQALAQAAQRWREITAELGLASQQAAYRRSLGLDL